MYRSALTLTSVLALMAVGYLLLVDPEVSDDSSSELPELAAESDREIGSTADGSTSPKEKPTSASSSAAGSESASTRPDSPAAVLKAALLDADRQVRGVEVLEVRRLLDRVLVQHPHLRAELAKSLGSLTNRELAFQVARLLGAHTGEEAVREALLQHLRQGRPVAREAAITAFWGKRNDSEVATAVANAFAEPKAAANVRSAAACGLVEMLPSLEPYERRAVQQAARDLAFRSQQPASLRAEALDLVDIDNPTDRSQVRRLMESPDTEPELALGAARVLLQAGESPDTVLSALDEAVVANLDPETARVLSHLLEADGGSAY